MIKTLQNFSSYDLAITPFERLCFLEINENQKEIQNLSTWLIANTIYYILKHEGHSLGKSMNYWKFFLRRNRFKIKNVKETFGKVLSIFLR